MKFKYHIIYFINKFLRRNYPCGRTKKDKYLCCKRPISSKSSYLSKDKKEVYCKYCNSIQMSSSEPIRSLDNWSPW